MSTICSDCAKIEAIPSNQFNPGTEANEEVEIEEADVRAEEVEEVDNEQAVVMEDMEMGTPVWVKINSTQYPAKIICLSEISSSSLRRSLQTKEEDYVYVEFYNQSAEITEPSYSTVNLKDIRLLGPSNVLDCQYRRNLYFSDEILAWTLKLLFL